jgi:hypothetical protein
MAPVLGVLVLLVAAGLFFAWAMHLGTVNRFASHGLLTEAKVTALTQTSTVSAGKTRRVRLVHVEIQLAGGKKGAGAASELLPAGVFDSLRQGSGVAVRYLPDSVHDDGSGGYRVDEVLVALTLRNHPDCPVADALD